VGELQAMLPRASDLLVGLQRVVEATVVGVDGTGLTCCSSWPGNGCGQTWSVGMIHSSPMAV
jgi:hypothetical protein